ncbi:hypothetical protein FACS18949_15800 [Clostridia bacterium]|nr:hypothetical protein FACS18949_15800 [Clostridia bacterium]
MEETANEFFERLYRDNFAKIHRHCHDKLRDYPFDADDCVQNTFTLALTKIEQIRKHENAVGWLYKTARHMIHKAFANIESRGEIENIDDYSEIIGDLDVSFAEFSPSDETITVAAIEVLADLCDAERTLLRQFYHDGTRSADIAKVLNIPHSTCRTRLHRLHLKVDGLVREMAQQKFI